MSTRGRTLRQRKGCEPPAANCNVKGEAPERNWTNGGDELDEWDDECFAAAKPESAGGIRDGPLVPDPEKPPLSLLCGACQLRQLLLEQSSQHHAFTDAARKLDTYPKPLTDISGRRVGLPSIGSEGSSRIKMPF